MTSHAGMAAGPRARGEDEDIYLIPLSALQHAVYCLRQAALIHIERLWAENVFTAEGQVLHLSTHEAGSRKLRGFRRVRALPIASPPSASPASRISSSSARRRMARHPIPSSSSAENPSATGPMRCSSAVRRYASRRWRAANVPAGALFYGESKRRVAVAFDAELRALTMMTIARLREVFDTGRTPPAIYEGEPLSRLFASRAMSAQSFGPPGSCLARARARRASRRECRFMKSLLNTIYVTTEGAGLRKDGENLVAEVDGAERARVPLHMLASVVVFGAIFLSPGLIQACASAGISIALLDRGGRFQARIEGPVTGNVLLRRAQYRASDAPDEIVRGFVLGKISNQRVSADEELARPFRRDASRPGGKDGACGQQACHHRKARQSREPKCGRPAW